MNECEEQKEKTGKKTTTTTTSVQNGNEVKREAGDGNSGWRASERASERES